MRLVHVLALTNASLINDPFVSNFTNIAFEAKDVKRGDLFIAFDETAIKDAIFNGAYGIIFDKPTQISDNEIAWIKVKDIKESLKKLLRFKLIENNIISYSCDEITLQLALQIVSESKFLVVDGDLKSIAQTLWNIEEETITLFSSTLSDKDIFTDIKTVEQSQRKYIQIREKTLFETSFIYDEKYYERECIPPLFIEKLNNLINLYKIYNVEFRLKRFSPLENFEAIFINKKFEIKDFGSTERVLIFEKNINFVESEINFLRNNSSWARTIYILPSSYNIKNKEDSNVYRYNKSKDIIKILKKADFNFAFIAENDKSILEKPIITQTQLTLDF